MSRSLASALGVARLASPTITITTSKWRPSLLAVVWVIYILCNRCVYGNYDMYMCILYIYKCITYYDVVLWYICTWHIYNTCEFIYNYGGGALDLPPLAGTGPTTWWLSFICKVIRMLLTYTACLYVTYYIYNNMYINSVAAWPTSPLLS